MLMFMLESRRDVESEDEGAEEKQKDKTPSSTYPVPIDMASPVDTFKSSLFGQLKSYSTAVQGVFEQRIARPILAFKRDLSRPASETRCSADHDVDSSYRMRQSSTSSSSPLEISDIETSTSIKSIFDKVKNTLSPSTKRRTSENSGNNGVKKNSIPSIKPSSETIARKHRLQSRKSVSFADDVDNDSDSSSTNQCSTDDRNEIVRNAHALADRILMESIDEIANRNRSNRDFVENFQQTVRPPRIPTNDAEDLVYQDLSAEIVAYILKHALRTLRKEHEQAALPMKHDRIDGENDFIDLK